MPKLIILRGNSGSGKSSTARIVRERMGAKTALVEQDYFRRIVLKEKDQLNGDNIELIRQTVEFALNHGYNVVLEGIMATVRYKTMLVSLIEAWPEHFIYYYDVSFEETLRRHQTKPNAKDFGEKDMAEWYRVRDILAVEGEKVIGEEVDQEDIVRMILKDCKVMATK